MYSTIDKICFWSLFLTIIFTGGFAKAQCASGCPAGSTIVTTSNWNVPTTGLTYCIPSGQTINTIQSINPNNVVIYNYGTITGSLNSFNSQNSKIYNCGLINVSGFNVPQSTFIYNSNRFIVSGGLNFNGTGGGFYALTNSYSSFSSLTLNGGSSLTVSGVVNVLGSLTANNGAISGGTGNGTLSVTGSFTLNSPSSLNGPSLTINKAPTVNGSVTIGSDVSSVFTPSILSYSPTYFQLCAGTSTTLSVIATSTGNVLNPNFSYEWQFQTISGGSWIPISASNLSFCSGFNSKTLTMTSIPLSFSGYFVRVKVMGVPTTNFVTSPNSSFNILKSGTSFSVNITSSAANGICPNSSVLVTASTNGNGSVGFYKWVRNGFFFTTNPSLGMTVSGATFYFATVTANSSIKAVYYDNCFTNPATSNGLNIFPATLATWEGTTDRDWFVTTNWKCGVLPNSNLSGTIPENLLNYPQINMSGAVCKNLVLGTNAALSILGVNSLQVYGSVTNAGVFFHEGSGFVNFNNIASISGTGEFQLNNLSFANKLTFLSNTVSLSGDLINNGSLDHKTSMMILNGLSKQSILGNAVTVYGINITNALGLIINTPVFVKSSFAFMSGIVTTSSTNTLTFNTSSTALKASQSSYVRGPVVKLGSGNFDFPIGGRSSFRPISVTGITSSNAITSIEYNDTKTSNSMVNVNSQYITLKDCEYWRIKNLTSPVVPFSLKLAYEKGDVCNLTCENSYKVVSSVQNAPWNVENTTYTNGVLATDNTIPITDDYITSGSIQFLIDNRFVNYAPYKVKILSQGQFSPINFSSANGTNGGLFCLNPPLPVSSDSVIIQIMENQDKNDSLAIAFSFNNKLEVKKGIKVGKKGLSGLHNDYYDFVSDPFKGKILRFYLNKDGKGIPTDLPIGTNLSKGIIANSDSLIVNGLNNFASVLSVYDIDDVLRVQATKNSVTAPSISVYVNDLSSGTYKYVLRIQKNGSYSHFLHNGQFIKPD